MIQYHDNLLPNKLFNSFNKTMIWRDETLKFDPKIRLKNFSSGDEIQEQKATFAKRIKSGVVPIDDDYTEIAALLGSKEVPAVIKHVKNFLIKVMKLNNPKVYGNWFQFMNQTQRIGKHFDAPSVGGKPINQSFSSFLYMHDTWEDDWGGEICFNGKAIILPKPNRLVVYSRDEEHWVNEFTGDYKRMFLGLSWSTDDI